MGTFAVLRKMGMDIPNMGDRPPRGDQGRARVRRAKLDPEISDAELRELSKRALADILRHGEDRDRARAAAVVLGTIEAHMAPPKKDLPPWYKAPEQLPPVPDAEVVGVEVAAPYNVVPLRPGE